MFGWQAAYAQAKKFEKNGDWEAAIRVYKGLIKRGQDNNPRVVFRLGHALFRTEKLDEALPHLKRAVELAPHNSEWEYRLAFVYERNKDYNSAIQHYELALKLDGDQPKWNERLQKCVAATADIKRSADRSALDDILRSKGPAWEQMQMLEAGYNEHKSDKEWLKNYGKSLFAMNKFEESARIFTELNQLDSKDAESHFMCGWAWQSCGRSVIAEKCFERALEFDTSRDAKKLGVGVFYQGKGQWRLAADAYKTSLTDNPENAELNYRAGLSLQKTYAWQEAERFLGRAVMLNPDIPLWHYRRGLSFERLGNMGRAASCYMQAATASPGRNLYWSFRLGQTMAAMGDFESACNAYKKSYISAPPEIAARHAIANNDSKRYTEDLISQALDDALASQSGALCYTVGRKAESLGLLPIAERAYRAAVGRLEKHDPNVYYSLGRVFAAQGKWEAGAGAFSDVRVFRRAFGVDVTPYLKTRASERSMSYLEYSETTSIDSNVIVYESSHGVSVSCNPLAIYRHIIKDSRFDGILHVWVLNDKNRIPEELRNRPNVVFVARESDLYLRYIASAKYLINNNTFPPYFVRRSGQEYLNTWHGTPIKTLGRDIQSGVMDHKNAARNFLQTTHIIAPNKFTADCLVEKYDIADIYTGKMAITGYPRNDSTGDVSHEKNIRLRKRLGIPDGRKVVLYAPTWRGTLANKSVDENRLARDLEAFGIGDWHFLYRGHSVNEGSTSGSTTDRYSVPSDIDTNDLLALVDVLVTDYSSIMFDFMVTGRPIVYYAYDLEQYQIERGLYFDLQDMGGAVCESLDEAMQAINTLSRENAASKNDSAPYVKELHELECGNSTQRVIDFFFFGDTEFVSERTSSNQPNVLLYAGSFIPNGVTASYLNLVSQLPADRYNLHTVVDPGTVASDPSRQAKFMASPHHVRAIGRVGIHLVTPEERWVIDKFNSQHDLDSEEMWTIYERAHRREFQRIFGPAKFDAIVSFEGYARFWASVLGNPYVAPQVSSIYLHSVMNEEWNNRFPYLEGMFRLYKRYDHLLSVSKSAAEMNALDLGAAFNLPSDSFSYVNNVLNPQEVLEAATADLDDDMKLWLGRGHKTFVSVGRLSPEKGHLKLLEAFSVVVESYPEARLIIVGDGPMRRSIEASINRFGIADSVYLAGMRTNPYAIVKNADCFVFSSDYEGQGIAILEALILNMPVVSTDVVGARSVLEEGLGLLVDDSPLGLADGMLQYLGEGFQYPRFDYEAYLKNGVESFTALALCSADRHDSILNTN